MSNHCRPLSCLVIVTSLVAAGCGQGSAPPASIASKPDTANQPAPQIEDRAPPVEDKAPTSAAAAETPSAAAALETPSAETAEPAPKKPAREPIYYTDKPGREQIDVALRIARRDHKHVLVEWGGNWCGWCYKLRDLFHKNEDVQPIVFEEFVLVLVDCDANRDLMLEYGGQDREYSFPHLTVLEAEGKVLTNQETGSLEKGPIHDPEKVAAFLKKWSPERQDAEDVLAAALKQAEESGRRVLIRVGTPYCGWCTILAQFVQDHEELFAKDYVDLKLDTLRMTNGDPVAVRYQPKRSLGVPWMVILDPSGKTLADSVGPNGNIGYPYQEPEIEHFVGMLRETRKNLTDEDLAQITNDLNEYRTKREAAAAEIRKAASR